MAARKPKFDATFTPQWRVDFEINGEKTGFTMAVADAPQVSRLFAQVTSWLEAQMGHPAEEVTAEEASAILAAMKDPDSK